MNAEVGQRVTVREITPPVYPLRDGLKAGDVVKLLEFDHGYWKVERERDCLRTMIYMVNVDKILS